MTIQSKKNAHAPCFETTLGAAKTHCNYLELFYGCLQGSFNKTTNYKKIPHKKLMKRKLSQKLLFCIRRGLNKSCKNRFYAAHCSFFGKLKTLIEI